MVKEMEETREKVECSVCLKKKSSSEVETVVNEWAEEVGNYGYRHVELRPVCGACIAYELAGTEKEQLSAKYNIHLAKDIVDVPIVESIKDLTKQGSQNLIAGAPGASKSWLGLDAAISEARGEKFLGKFQCKKTNVMYMCLDEQDVNLTKDRINMLTKNNPPDNLFITDLNGLQFNSRNYNAIDLESTKVRMQELLAFCQSKQIGSIYVDTISDAFAWNPNSEIETALLLSLVNQYFTKSGITLTYISHTIKGSRANKEYSNLSGSHSIDGKMISLFELHNEGDPEDNPLRIRVDVWKQKYRRQYPDFIIEKSYDEATKTVSLSYIDTVKREAETLALELMPIIEKWYNDNKLTEFQTGDVKEEFEKSYSESTIKNALKKMVKKTTLKRAGKGRSSKYVVV